MENKENEVKKCKHCQSDIPKKPRFALIAGKSKAVS